MDDPFDYLTKEAKRVRAASHDNETAHGLEDDLMIGILRLIASGVAEPQELARLTVAHRATFTHQRWYA